MFFPIEGDAAASPAAEQPTEPAAAAPAAKPAGRLSELTDTERLEWRKTGKLPDAKAATSTATPAEEPAAVTTATSEQASEPADDDPEYKPKTAKRIQALLDENKRLKAEAARRTAPATQPAAPAASAPAPAATAASTLVEPDPEKFTYGTADPAYLKALTTYAVQKAQEEAAAKSADDARKRSQTAEMTRIQESWKTRVADAKKKYADFESVALATDTKIPQGSLIDSWILESEHGADVLYDLQKNPAEVDRLLALTPLAQTRELVKLEERILSAKPKLVTSAPEPGETLTARSADPGGTDPIRRAVKKRDVGAYIREANAAELKARRR